MLHPATRHLRGLAASADSQAELDACVSALTDLFALDVTASLRAGATGSAPHLSVPPPAPKSLPEPASASMEDLRDDLRDDRRVSNPVLSDKLG
jgi:hypothetical protein